VAPSLQLVIQSVASALFDYLVAQQYVSQFSHSITLAVICSVQFVVQHVYVIPFELFDYATPQSAILSVSQSVHLVIQLLKQLFIQAA
jgi:hypothetical protein